ncbi:MAG TPA: CRISPR-associated endonuclease Cas1 [Candidatus Binatia bacterium]|nr:CRISPR-associated endonuclease Cas1 [Candidatus Binatia bacterium]
MQNRGSRAGDYPYVSAQAVRYWMRTYLERSIPEWQAAPVFREVKIAYTDANPLLYGYGILYSQVWGAVLNAGLEPFAGFLHVDRLGKPSLVLDLVEEFRQPVVDRAVIVHLNLGEEVKLVQGMLEAETRKALVERVMNRLLTTETYQGKRYQVRSILQMQARRLASFLRGEGAYKAFSFKW